MLVALEQRRAKYAEASNQAKASGDERKARMHDRIAKVTGDPSSLDRHVYTCTAFLAVAFWIGFCFVQHSHFFTRLHLGLF